MVQLWLGTSPQGTHATTEQTVEGLGLRTPGRRNRVFMRFAAGLEPAADCELLGGHSSDPCAKRVHEVFMWCCLVLLTNGPLAWQPGEQGSQVRDVKTAIV